MWLSLLVWTSTWQNIFMSPSKTMKIKTRKTWMKSRMKCAICMMEMSLKLYYSSNHGFLIRLPKNPKRKRKRSKSRRLFDSRFLKNAFVIIVMLQFRNLIWLNAAVKLFVKDVYFLKEKLKKEELQSLSNVLSARQMKYWHFLIWVQQCFSEQFSMNFRQ